MKRRKEKDGTTILEGGALTVPIMLNIFYPVGSVIMTVDNTNPNTRFGFSGTTWVAFGAGRAVVGVGSNGVNTYTSEQQFGADTCTLTDAQSGVNAHTHGNTGIVSSDHTHNVTALQKTANASGTSSDNGGGAVTQGTTTGRFVAVQSGAAPSTGGISANHTHAVGAVASPTAATPHDIRQTSIAVYLWKRTV